MSTWPIHPLRGGVHPPQCKSLSNQQPIQSAPLPKQLIVPLLMCQNRFKEQQLAC